MLIKDKTCSQIMVYPINTIQKLIIMGCNRALRIPALFVIFDLFCSSHAFDTINRTHFISDSKNESLGSSDGNFRLGFFSPGKSQARYVGIWHDKISQQTVVWVANRANPITNCAGVFKIGGDGNLAVFCGNQSSPLWSTNISVAAGTSTAKLLDSGNLVLVSNETIIWQSFDYPTDTILPGMKFGLNWKTGLNHMLTSWKSIDDPTTGEFSLRLDSHGIPQFFMYKRFKPYWRAGPWNGRNLNGIPNGGQKIDYSDQIDLPVYTFVNNENESYFIFTSAMNAPHFSIVVLQPTGTMKRLIWNERHKWVKFWMAPQDLCDEYDQCGANGICNLENALHCSCLPGFQSPSPQELLPKCEETRKLDGCGKGDGEGFVRMEAVKLPDAKNSTLYSNMNLKECERQCLKSCNCTGYAILDVTGSGRGCITWYGDLRDIRPYKEGQDFYLRVDAVELAAHARRNSKHFLVPKGTLAFIIVPVVVEMILAVMCFYYIWRRQMRRKAQKQKKQLHQKLVSDLAGSLSNHKDSPNSSDQSGNIELTLFKLSTIIAATDQFSSSNKLGQGGFGPVYKGKLPDGQEIGVKRLSTNSRQGILEFKNEVLLIAKLQHRNLVKLLGYCIAKDEKMLIYEFMPNKSLDFFIFDQSRKLLLNWKMRFDIILGIARGILYLHQDSRLRIIHRDLKVSNILLDGNMEPKISDFGTARILGGDRTQGNTKRVVGTYGYMSPEYALDGRFSMKSDVFSFGVILLEIISGKRNKGFFNDDPYSNLIQYMWELWRDGKALEIVDLSMNDLCPSNEVIRCIQVGLLCVQDNVKDRPSMSTAVFMLSNETILPSPKKSSFAIRKNEPDLSTRRTKCSINGVSNTTIYAR